MNFGAKSTYLVTSARQYGSITETAGSRNAYSFPAWSYCNAPAPTQAPSFQEVPSSLEYESAIVRSKRGLAVWRNAPLSLTCTLRLTDQGLSTCAVKETMYILRSCLSVLHCEVSSSGLSCSTRRALRNLGSRLPLASPPFHSWSLLGLLPFGGLGSVVVVDADDLVPCPSGEGPRLITIEGLTFVPLRSTSRPDLAGPRLRNLKPRSNGPHYQPQETRTPSK